jgi:toxin-antitoxin system PIN domain toxin
VFVVDTNVLVHAADDDSQFHVPCRRLVEESRAAAGAWYVTWAICYEFLRVTTHARVLRNPWSVREAWGFIDALLAAPSAGVLVPTERHRAVAGEVLAAVPHLAGNILHDAHTAVLMREHGIRTIYTRDTDFHRFGFLEPVDPVARPGRGVS